MASYLDILRNMRKEREEKAEQPEQQLEALRQAALRRLEELRQQQARPVVLPSILSRAGRPAPPVTTETVKSMAERTLPPARPRTVEAPRLSERVRRAVEAVTKVVPLPTSPLPPRPEMDPVQAAALGLGILSGVLSRGGEISPEAARTATGPEIFRQYAKAGFDISGRTKPEVPVPEKGPERLVAEAGTQAGRYPWYRLAAEMFAPAGTAIVSRAMPGIDPFQRAMEAQRYMPIASRLAPALTAGMGYGAIEAAARGMEPVEAATYISQMGALFTGAQLAGIGIEKLLNRVSSWLKGSKIDRYRVAEVWEDNGYAVREGSEEYQQMLREGWQEFKRQGKPTVLRRVLPNGVEEIRFVTASGAGGRPVVKVAGEPVVTPTEAEAVTRTEVAVPKTEVAATAAPEAPATPRAVVVTPPPITEVPKAEATVTTEAPKPYEGLRPGTPEWMAVWRAHPELQKEMLEYQKKIREAEARARPEGPVAPPPVTAPEEPARVEPTPSGPPAVALKPAPEEMSEEEIRAEIRAAKETKDEGFFKSERYRSMMRELEKRAREKRLAEERAVKETPYRAKDDIPTAFKQKGIKAGTIVKVVDFGVQPATGFETYIVEDEKGKRFHVLRDEFDKLFEPIVARPATTVAQTYKPKPGERVIAKDLRTGQEFIGTFQRVGKRGSWVYGVIRLDDGSEKLLSLTKHVEWRPASKKPAEVTGTTATAKTERGTKVETQYAVVSADNLISSHDTGLKPDERYPKELQPRLRERAASEVQIRQMMGTLEPEFLGESPKASEGAPIVGPDMVVESGNARVITLKRLYESKHENATKYRNWLLDNADRFGLDRSAIEKVDNPVLVRIRTSDVDRAKFVEEANEAAVAAMSATEQAVADAKKLTGGLMAQFVPDEQGRIVTLANRDFINRFMTEVIGRAEAGRYLTAEGGISQEGIARIRNAVFAKAYGDIAAIEKLAEDPDNNVRNITNAMLIAAPKLAAIKEAIAAGDLYDLDITPDIAAAMNKLSALRESGETVRGYLSQIKLFGEDLSDLGKDILQVFDKYSRSTKKLAEILLAYADIVENAGSPKQLRLIEGGPPSKAEALDLAIKRVEGEPSEQPGLFEGEAGSRGAAGENIPRRIAPKEREEVREGQREEPRPAEAKERVETPELAKPTPPEGIEFAGWLTRATGNTYPVREELKRRGFQWDGRVWARLDDGLTRQAPIKGITFDVSPAVRGDFDKVADAFQYLTPVFKRGMVYAVGYSDAVKKGLIDRETANKAKNFYKEGGEESGTEPEPGAGGLAQKLATPGLPGVQGEFTGLDYRIPLRDVEAGAYGKILVARGKAPAEGARYAGGSASSEAVLRPHQKDGVNLAIAAMEAYGGFILADGTGVGKTMEELAVADFLASKGNNVLIVTPSRSIVKDAFQRDSKLLGCNYNLLEGSAQPEKGKINITTYASLGKITVQPDYVIFDESHYLKNAGTQQSKRGINLAKNAKGAVFASATPLDKAEHIKYLAKTGIFEKYSMTRVMEGLGYKYVEKQFGRKKIGMWERRIPREEAEAKLEAFFDELADRGLLVKREISMEPVEVHFISLKTPEEAVQRLASIEEFYRRKYHGKSGLAEALLLMAQRRFLEPYKIDPAIDIIEREMKDGRQVVLFATRYEPSEIAEQYHVIDDIYIKEVLDTSEGTLKELAEKLESRGIKVARIFGSGNVEDEVRRFQSGECTVAIATPQKGGAGLSLDDQRGDAPRTMIVMTAPFSAVENVQMAGRINRLNTASKSKIIYLLMADSDVDTWNINIIADKMKTLHAAVKGEIGKLEVKKPSATEKVYGMLRRPPAREVRGTRTSIKPIQKADIFRYIERNFEVPIRRGRYGGRARGIYKHWYEVIRTRKAMDIETSLHELGHHLDKVLDLERLGADSELRAFAKAQGAKKDFREEGVAEFFRLYFTDPGEAEKAVPSFYREFEALIGRDKELKDRLDGLRDMISDYVSEDPVSKVRSTISVGEKERRKFSLDQLVTAWLDDLYPIEKAEKIIAEGAKIPAQQSAYVLARLHRTRKATLPTQWLEYGQLDDNLKKIGPSLKEILQPVSDRLDDFRAYIVSKHALDVIAQGKSMPLPKEEYEAAVKALESPGFKTAHEQLEEYRKNLLEWLARKGNIPKEAVSKWREKYPWYVPLYRVFDDSYNAGVGGLRKGFSGVKPVVKRLKGSTRPIIDPIESIVKDTIVFIDAGLRNEVVRAFVDLVKRFEGHGDIAEPVLRPVRPIKIPAEAIRKEVEKALAEAGLEPDEFGVDWEEAITIFRPGMPFDIAKENITFYWVEGKPQYVQMHPEVYRAMKALEQENLHPLLNLANVFTRVLRNGHILNPGFWLIRNPVRDNATAYLYSKYGYRYLADWFAGFFHVLKQDKWYREFEASGGPLATMAGLDRDHLQRIGDRLIVRQPKGFKAVLRTFAAAPDWINMVAEAVEKAPRVSEYVHARQKGKSQIEAAFAAQEVTVPFPRAGTWGRAYNRLSAFFNARVQGLSKTAREWRARPLELLLKSFISVTIPSVLLWFVNKDNKYYQALPRWRKVLCWNVPIPGTGGKYFVPIPRNFVEGLVFGAAVEAMLDRCVNDNPKAFEGAVEAAKGELPSFLPTILQGWIGYYANKNLFTGTPIVPEYEKQLPPEYQYGPGTTEVAKLVGQALNISPRHVDAFIRAQTGTLGALAAQALSGIIKVFRGEPLIRPGMRITDIPIVKDFIASPEYSSDDVEQFYREYSRLMEVKNAISAWQRGVKPMPKFPRKRLEEFAEKGERFEKYEQVMRKLRSIRRVIEAAEDADPEIKREAIRKCNIAIINAARAALGKELLE